MKKPLRGKKMMIKVYDVHFALIAGLLFDLKSELIFFIR